MPQEALRVGKRRSEGHGAAFAVEIGQNRLDAAGVVVDAPVRQHQLDGRGLLLRARGVDVEVLGLRDVEVHPDRAVVGEGGQGVALAQEAAAPGLQVAHDAVERRANQREALVGVGEGQFGLRAVVVGLRQGELVGRDDVLVGEELGVGVLDAGARQLGFGLLGLGLVEGRLDLEHPVAARHPLAFVDEGVLQVAALLGAQLDVLDGAHLGDVFLGQVGGLPEGAGDGEFGGCFGVVGLAVAPGHPPGGQHGGDQCDSVHGGSLSVERGRRPWSQADPREPRDPA
ncbi:hypothetical protein D3C72_760780 [compost metagenome]